MIGDARRTNKFSVFCTSGLFDIARMKPKIDMPCAVHHFGKCVYCSRRAVIFDTT